MPRSSSGRARKCCAAADLLVTSASYAFGTLPLPSSEGALTWAPNNQASVTMFHAKRPAGYGGRGGSVAATMKRCSFDVPRRQVVRDKVIVMCDGGLRLRFDRRSEPVTVVGVAQMQSLDEKLISGGPARPTLSTYLHAEPEDLGEGRDALGRIYGN